MKHISYLKKKQHRKTNKSKKIKKNTNKRKQSRGKTQKGKGLFNYFRQPVNNIKLMFQKAKTSETKLINNYETMAKSIDQYYNAYNTHLTNLIQLDTFLNNNNFETLFKKILIKEHFKKDDIIDRTLPLLLRNFVVGDDTSTTALRRELIIKQIRYKLYSTFPEREQALINDINVKVDRNNEVVMMLRTIDNQSHKNILKHTDFLLDMAYLNGVLKRIIKPMKDKLKYESNIPKNNNSNYSLVNSNNLYSGVPDLNNTNTNIKSKKIIKGNNYGYGYGKGDSPINRNNMVNLGGDTNNNKSENSGSSFNMFNSNSHKNSKKQNRKPYVKPINPDFKLGLNLGATGPEQQSPETPPLDPIKGFLPLGYQKNMLAKQGQQGQRGQQSPNSPSNNCETYGSDPTLCKSDPKCFFNFNQQICKTRDR